AGIDPRHYQSGKTEKADIITRHGRPRARLVMYQIIVGMLLNQQRTPSHITDYYYKMKRQPFNKKHMVAVTACMNQLTRTI
ncbi:transposase, partial [Lactobacillus selangorensis]|uniref:transposase n=1 Tax=Lactobacillus selangorensis TaxID=81857 RepID=UPI0012E73672